MQKSDIVRLATAADAAQLELLTRKDNRIAQGVYAKQGYCEDVEMHLSKK